MGIRGLSSYIQNRSSKCLKDHELQNCDVVIDGNNLVHFSFLSCPRQNACFGGDYNSYYDHVKDIFRLMKACKVNPIIVFDGGLDVGNRKYRTRLYRANQKLIASIKVKPSNQHRMSVLPLLAKTVFIAVLKELKIEVIQCQYEADLDIAALARGLDCPVISNDSDFFAMNVLVIPTGSLDLCGATKNANGKSIRCKLFQIDSFLQSIGHQDASIFPLLGTLLGNDYADARLFENVFSQIHIPKNKSMTDQHRRLQGLLEWLKDQTVEDAIDQILEFIKKANRNEVEIAIRTSLEAYEDGNRKEINCQALRDRTREDLIEEGIPDWFAELYTNAVIPCWVLEIMMCQRVPYHSQVESIHYKSSFVCCFDLLKTIAWISWKATNSRMNMGTLWRKGSELLLKRVNITADNFQLVLPRLNELSSLGCDEKEQLIYAILLGDNAGDIPNLPSKWKLVFASVIHWVRHSTCNVKSYHIDALIMSIIHLSMIEPKIGRIRNLKRLESIVKTKQKDDPLMPYYTAMKNTIKLNDVDDRMLSHDINYDRDVVHTLNEFQATYYYALTLCQVVDTELQCAVPPSAFFNGTFIHQAVSLLKGHPDRIKLTQRLYGGAATVLYQQFESYCQLVYALIPSDVMEWLPKGPNRPRKRSSRKKKKDNVVEVHSSDTSDQESGLEEIVDLIDNRFNLLSLTS